MMSRRKSGQSGYGGSGIARAAADPAVLLLDEITANLDAETEARVLAALRRASRGRTVLSISHRVYEDLGGRTVEINAARAEKAAAADDAAGKSKAGRVK